MSSPLGFKARVGSLFTVRNSSCGKVMFSHASVILFTEGCVADTPLDTQTHTPHRQTPPWSDTPLVRHLSGQTSPWADTPPNDSYWNYWNAFLFTLGRGVCVIHSMRVTSGATLADLLMASMAAELFSSTYLRSGLGAP